MDIVEYRTEFHEEVSRWWKHYGFASMPERMLPKTGFVIVENATAICAGWMYKSDSDIAWVEWVVANPEYDKIKRSEALDLLLARLIKEARDQGFGAIFTTLHHERLIERYAKHGFQKGDSGMTTMIMPLE